MLKKIIKLYYKLLDEKLENGTMVVILIAILIISASLITKDADALYMTKANINERNFKSTNIVEINGNKYKFILEKIRDDI